MQQEWDTTNRNEFVRYYTARHAEPATIEGFRNARDALLAVYGSEAGSLDVLDIGCNAGGFSKVWAEAGHRVVGIDVSESLIDAARASTATEAFSIDFWVASATELPLPDASFDIVCMPELLEHVADWEACLREAIRVLRPGGAFSLSTSNWLCPVQHEFNLPLYSWYPPFVKRRFERLAVTTRPELVAHATYPAVHWFSFYGLRRYFRQRGLACLDRFDVAAAYKQDPKVRAVLWLIRRLPGVRLLGHMLTPGTQVVARRPR